MNQDQSPLVGFNVLRTGAMYSVMHYTIIPVCIVVSLFAFIKKKERNSPINFSWWNNSLALGWGRGINPSALVDSNLWNNVTVRKHGNMLYKFKRLPCWHLSKWPWQRCNNSWQSLETKHFIRGVTSDKAHG